VKQLSYGVTVVVGVLALLFVLNPPRYLQDLIVFASGGLAACFLVPMVLSLYSTAMTATAAIAGMLGGTISHLGLTCWGYVDRGEFTAYEYLGLNPFIWDLAGSALACWLAIRFGPAPDPVLAEKFFGVGHRSDHESHAQ
jgi:Na+/proline symporter